MRIELETADRVKLRWHQFIRQTEPVRPELHYFCRSLSGNVFTAEELIQLTLMQAFTTLSLLTHPIQDVRRYVLRLAAETWLRTIPGKDDLSIPGAADTVHTSGYGSPVTTLREMLDLSDSEIASIFRARKQLAESGNAPTSPATRPTSGLNRPASDALMDTFIAAFNRKDLKQLASLMHPNAMTDGLGMGVEYGRTAIGRENDKGCLYVTLFLGTEPIRAERRAFMGESLILIWIGTRGEEALNDLMRLDELNGSITRLRWYYFCPEALIEVGKVLNIPVRTNGYRFDYEAELAEREPERSSALP